MFVLCVKCVASNGGDIGLVFCGPGRASCVVKIKRGRKHFDTFQAKFCSQNTFFVGGQVNGSAFCGGELILLKNNIVDGAGENGVFRAVENHIADGDLALDGLVAGLGINQTGQQVIIFLIVSVGQCILSLFLT